jgi:hypothetical protein
MAQGANYARSDRAWLWWILLSMIAGTVFALINLWWDDLDPADAAIEGAIFAAIWGGGMALLDVRRRRKAGRRSER